MKSIRVSAISAFFLLTLVSLIPSVAAQTTYPFFEGFEDETVGSNPSDPQITLTETNYAAGSFVSNEWAIEGTQSWKMTCNGNCASAAAVPTATWDLETNFAGNTTSFAVNCVTGGGAGGITMQFIEGPTTPTDIFSFQGRKGSFASPTGTGCEWKLVHDGGTTDFIEATSGVSIVEVLIAWDWVSDIAEWYLNGVSYGSFAFDNPADDLDSIYHAPFWLGSFGPMTYYVDAIGLDTDFIEEEGLIDITSIISATDIVGMDITKYGTSVILRTNAGDFIRTYDGDSLSPLFSEDTNCSQLNGVAAVGSGFAYFRCESGNGTNVENIKFIAIDGTPYPYSNCIDANGDCSEIDGSINLDSLGDENDFQDLVPVINGEIISTEVREPGIADDNYVFHDFVFGLTEVDGAVYALDVSFIQRHRSIPGPDEYTDYEEKDEASLVYSTNLANAICSNEALSVYLSDTSTATKGYGIDFDSDVSNPDTPTFDVDVDIVQNYGGTTAINSARDIDCGSTRILAGKTASVALVNIPESTLVWSITPTGTPLKVAYSFDQKWAAYTTSSRSYILNGTTGEFLCMVNNPSGTVVDTEMDALGQSLYVATDDNLAYTDIHTCTTGVIVEPGIGGGGSGTDSTSSTTGGGGLGGGGNTGTCESNFLGINISYVANAWNTTETPIRWLLGILLLVLVVYGFAKIGAGAILIGAAVVIGVGAGVAFCLFPVWLLLVIILLIALGVGSAFFNDNNEG